MSPAMRLAVTHKVDEVQKIEIQESSLYSVSRPVDVAYIRQEIVDWWSKPGEWQYRYALQGRRALPNNRNSEFQEAEGARWWTEQTFRQAELYWVNPDMSELIAKMYPTIPDCVAQPPCESGFVVFGKAIPGTDAANGGPIFTTGFMWGRATTTMGPCYSLETYAHKDVLYPWLGMDPKEQDMFREVMPLKLHPTGGSEWPTGTMISDFSLLGEEEPDREASMMEDRRLLATFWALCSQRITLEERWEPTDRHVRRQFARRKDAIPPAVRVIRLREPTARTRRDGEGEVEWSHRWIVGEHWRNQWYASEQKHRPKLIHAYQKGPSDKPLLVRETVKALVR